MRADAAHLRVTTAGVDVLVDDRTGRHAQALARAAGVTPEAMRESDGTSEPDVRVVVERDRRPFDTRRMQPVTRGVWSLGDDVVIESVGGSGFAQRWRSRDEGVEVQARWIPGPAERGASLATARFHALRAQVLLHYPALWWAGTRGLAPLHVSVLRLEGTVVLLAGPGGVGKSTLVAKALADGAQATCDNLAASDGQSAYGVREPLRLAIDRSAPTAGRRTTHGRREQFWDGHVPQLRPDLVVVVRRGARPQVRELDGGSAQRSLVAGTFAAGELRRFWQLTAVLGLATGRGPVLPAVTDVARTLSDRLPCRELELGPRHGPPLRDLLADYLHDSRQRGSSR